MERKLREDLRQRVREWGDAWKQLIIRCSTCEGRGSTRVVMGGRMLTRPCSYCDQTGRKVSDTAARKVFYDLRTPEWRSSAGSLQALGDSTEEFRKGADRKPVLTTYRLDRIDLIDATHAWTYVYFDGDSVPRSVAWVRSVEPGKGIEKWYLYMEATDGAWPQPLGSTVVPEGQDLPTAAAPGPPAKPEALSAEETAEIQSLVAKIGPYFRPSGYGKVAETLYITLDHEQYTRGEVLRAQLTDDAIQVVRRVYGETRRWSGLRLEFRSQWQSPMGARELRSLAMVGMTRSVHDGIHFQNLRTDEVFALFEVEWRTHEGWKLPD